MDYNWLAFDNSDSLDIRCMACGDVIRDDRRRQLHRITCHPLLDESSAQRMLVASGEMVPTT